MNRNPTSSSDPDFLLARLHARRSRVAESDRLVGLCRLHTVPELSRAIFSGTELTASTQVQRRLVQDLIQELSSCLPHLHEQTRDFLVWLLARFQMENVKVLLRGLADRTQMATVQRFLVTLPPDLALDVKALAGAKSIEEFCRYLPAGSPRELLLAEISGQPAAPSLLILEAALDGGYFRELLRRASRLPRSEWEIICPMIHQEVNGFQFLFAVRGRFHHGLPAASLSGLRVFDRGVGRTWFDDVLAAPDIVAAANCAAGILFDAFRSGPGSSPASLRDAATLETLIWQRYLRLANAAFRRSHMGLGALAGYFGVRRMEIANLISLSEGLRLGLEEGQIRRHLIPQAEIEVAHV